MFSLLNIRIGLFLAIRQLKRASLWTTGLTVFIMVLTFLNLVVVSGILVGLIQGSIDQVREQFTSDIFISAPDDKAYIENSPNLIQLLKNIPEVRAVTPRYRGGVVLEANYKTKRVGDEPDSAAAQIYGINPIDEDDVTDLGSQMEEGSYLKPGDFDQILIGRFLLSQYVPVDDPNLPALDNVKTGTKIRLTINGITREVTVKGIIDSKVDFLTRNVFMVDSELRSLIGRTDGNVAQIAVSLVPGADPVKVRDKLKLNGADKYAKVQTFEESQPKFLKDITNTFNMLGNFFSSIGLIVAAITIFIVVFINALTRKKFIGILKGIGINGQVIEISYIFQSIFYAVCGSVAGLIIVYALLVPLISAHPIDFPFSDGILVAPVFSTSMRVFLLVFSTLIAGYIPARMIIRKNTLDSILGRN